MITVPFSVSTGKVLFEDPEVFESGEVALEPGPYALTCAQKVIADELDEGPQEEIDLIFERVAEPLAKSRIVIADDRLQDVPNPLIETCQPAVV